MVLMFVLLVAAGLLMTFKPAVVWSFTESWKSVGAAEPSELYLWSTRFGGVLCTMAGVGGIVASWL